MSTQDQSKSSSNLLRWPLPKHVLTNSNIWYGCWTKRFNLSPKRDFLITMILGLSALLVASSNALLFLFLPFIGRAKGLETRVLSSPRGVWCHQPAELERAALLFFSCLWNEISRSWIHTISTQQKIQNIFSATHINAGQDNLFFSNAKCKHNPHYMIWSKQESHILPMKYKTRDHKVWDTYQYTWEWLYVAAHMGAPIPYCFICSVWPLTCKIWLSSIKHQCPKIQFG